MKLSTKIVTVVLVIVGSSGAVYAFGKNHGWSMSPQEKVEHVTKRVTKKLNLDSQQQQNFSQLAVTVADIMQEVKSTREQQFDEVASLLQEPSFNQARALELLQQKTQTINDKAPLVIGSLAVFLDSLSAEQKQQLQEFTQQHRDHRRHKPYGHGQ